jgi:tRNA(Ile)-lysidine synthase
VLPAIRQQWIGAVESIARSARHMAEADQLLTALGRADLARAADGDDVNVAVLRTLPAARRRNALRAWMSGRGIETPTTSQMREIAGRLLAARADAQPEIRWPGAVVRRRGGRLLIEVKSEVPVAAAEELISKSWLWSQQRECLLNQQGESLSLVDDPEGPIDLDRVGPALEVRAREGGETIRLGARARTQALKKLIQAAKMSVETRARLPLLFSGDRLVAAGDRWIDASILANDKSPRRARLVWSRRR